MTCNLLQKSAETAAAGPWLRFMFFRARSLGLLMLYLALSFSVRINSIIIYRGVREIQTELVRLFAVPLTHSVVFFDG